MQKFSNKNKLKNLTLCIAIALFSFNCSEVKFSPEDNIKLDNPDNPPDLFESAKDTFYQDDSTSLVDILVVIDNSPSMIEEQKKLGQKISSFMGHLNGVNWQLGVTTTDVSGGKYSTNGKLVNFKNTNYHILTNQNSDFNNLFIKTINRPESGCDFDCASSDEQPLKAIKMAIQNEHTSNQGFFRENSSFVAIVITDEDELSSGPSSATQPDEIVNLINQTWGSSKNFTLYGIIVKPKDKNCYEANKRTGGNYGNLIQKLANITGGITGSICDEDYGQSLSSIGNQVKNLLSSFTLSEEPLDLNQIQVQLTPQQEIKWKLDGKKVIFDKAPKAGTRIDIDYYKKKREYSSL